MSAQEEKELPPEVRKEKLLVLFEKSGNQMVRRILRTVTFQTKMRRPSNHSYFSLKMCVFQEVAKESLKDINNETSSCDDVEACLDTGLLILAKKDPLGEDTTVPNCCAICLECYQEGEIIVWSSSGECPHVYHRSCIADYFVHFQGKGSPCPSCRRNYCDFPA
jgi:hypothetical protein